MILLLRKKVLVAGMACMLLCGISCLNSCRKSDIPALLPISGRPYHILIDPGHGGEDGGAVSATGVTESDLNLEIGHRLRDLMILSGEPVSMLRSDDRALDSGESTIRQRKASDLSKRAQLVNEADNGFLISIHQNSLPASPETHGAQVFWNQNPRAKALAGVIQSDLNIAVNVCRPKQTRQIPGSVYLMKHINTPGVLIECGFLSNEAETELLQHPDHQKIMALSIASGYLQWLSDDEDSHETKDTILLHRVRK